MTEHSLESDLFRVLRGAGVSFESATVVPALAAVAVAHGACTLTTPIARAAGGAIPDVHPDRRTENAIRHAEAYIARHEDANGVTDEAGGIMRTLIDYLMKSANTSAQRRNA